MSLRLQKLLTFIAIVFLFAISTEGFAQSSNSYRFTVVSGDSIQTEFYSTNTPSISTQARHGVARIINPATPGSSTFTLRYIPSITPTPYLGKDTVVVELRPVPNSPALEYRTYVFDVVRSYVKAVRDYVSTTTNQSISIPVTANDTSSNTITVTRIPIVNNGTATIDGNNVIFTPTTDFRGISYLNYTVCDELGSCDNGVVTIVVTDANVPAHDTIREVLSKGTSIILPLMHGNMAVAVSASNGTTSFINPNFLKYTPQANFVGSDQFLLSGSNPSVSTLVMLDVRDFPTPNNLLINDNAYTTINASVEINVKQNDIITNFPLNSNSVTQPQHGNVVVLPNGLLLYTPEAGYTGIDKFFYSACILGDCETARVNVTVGTYEPVTFDFQFTIPANTPLVLNYAVPVSSNNIYMAIAQQATSGIAHQHLGNATVTLFNGNSVSGENMVIYEPNSNFVGTDYFELTYCPQNVSSNDPTCRIIKITVNVTDNSGSAEVCYDADCVWTGDTNNDGLVNMKDLLPIGWCLGVNGASRPNPTFDWLGQYSDDWSNPYETASNDLKFLDTDGNGYISAEDTTGISVSYGKIHNLVPNVPVSIRDSRLLLQTVNQGPYQAGDLVLVDILLGTQALPVNNIYGLAFSVNVDIPVDLHDLDITFDKNSWLSNYAPVLSLVKKTATTKLDAGYTLADRTPQTGYGKIGRLGFVIEDQLDGFRTGDYFQVTAKDITIANEYFGFEALPDMTINIPINAGSFKKFDENNIIIMPNPANNYVNIHLNGFNELNQIQIFNITGQLMTNMNASGKQATLDVSTLGTGLYFVRTITPQGEATKKLEIIRE